MKNLKQLRIEEKTSTIMSLWTLYGAINVIAFLGVYRYELIEHSYIIMANIPVILVWQYYLIGYYMRRDRGNTKAMYPLLYFIDLTIYFVVVSRLIMLQHIFPKTDGIFYLFGFVGDAINITIYSMCNVFILSMISIASSGSNEMKATMQNIRNILFVLGTFMIIVIGILGDVNKIEKMLRYTLPWLGIYAILLKFALIDIYKLITKK